MRLIDEIDPKFRSGNAVPVERASITAEEWGRIRAALEAGEEMAKHAPTGYDLISAAADRFRAAAGEGS